MRFAPEVQTNVCVCKREEQFAEQTNVVSRMGGSPPRVRRVVVEARHAFPTTGEEHNQEIESAALKLKGGRQAREKTAKLPIFSIVCVGPPHPRFFVFRAAVFHSILHYRQ